MRIGQVSKRAICVAAATLLSAIFVPTLSPDPAAAAPSQCQNREALDALLAAPGNLDAAIAHAKCAVEQGEFESAVATFEALLIYTPENAQLELDLADLYVELGSVELARAHYQNVLAVGGLSDELRQRAELGLANLSNAGGDSFGFSHFAAWRWQDNANLGLTSASILVGSTRVTVPANQTKKADNSMWHEGGLSARVASSGVLDNAVDAWQLDVDWYGNWQDKAKSLDSILINAQFGPEFSIAAFDTLIRPYLSVGYSELQEKPLYRSWGGGVRLYRQISERLGWESNWDYRSYAYDDNSLRTLSTSYDGEQFSSNSSLTYLVNDSLQLSASTHFTFSDLVDDQYSYRGSGIAVGATLDSGVDPFNAGSIALDFSVGFETRDHMDPSTSAPFVTRSDEQISAGLEADIPLSANLSLVSRLEYDQVNSNDPFSDYEAITAYVGLRVSQ